MLDALTAARAHRVVSAWGIGALHASLGDVDEAYRWLEIAVHEKGVGTQPATRASAAGSDSIGPALLAARPLRRSQPGGMMDR